MAQTRSYCLLLSCFLVWTSMKKSQAIDSEELTNKRKTPLLVSSAYLYITPNSHPNSEDGLYDDSYGCQTSYEDPDGDCIIGAAEIDYPVYSKVPHTRFSCQNHHWPGYYADTDARCQVFHICETSGRQHSHLCPNGTMFNQEVLVCDWWYNVDCSSSGRFYDINDYIYRFHDYGSRHVNPNHDQHHAPPYSHGGFDEARGFGTVELVTEGPHLDHGHRGHGGFDEARSFGTGEVKVTEGPHLDHGHRGHGGFDEVRGFGTVELVTGDPDLGHTPRHPNNAIYSREFVPPRGQDLAREAFPGPSHRPPIHNSHPDLFQHPVDDSFELQSIQRPTHKITRQTTYKISSKKPTTTPNKGKN